MNAVGGSSGKKVLNSVEKYDPDTDDWTYVSSMHFKRRKHAACVINGKIIVVGGTSDTGQPVHEIECYNPSIDEWCIVGKIEIELENHFLVAI